MIARHLTHPLVLLCVATAMVSCTQQRAPTAQQAAAGDPALGAELYANNCARCHGAAAEGTDAGPSFLNDVYVPSHHADEAFQIAAARGVQAHHWDFGPMPAVGVENDLSREDVSHITAHVRMLQAQAGLITGTP